jgi:hypothetical protein
VRRPGDLPNKKNPTHQPTNSAASRCRRAANAAQRTASTASRNTTDVGEVRKGQTAVFRIMSGKTEPRETRSGPIPWRGAMGAQQRIRDCSPSIMGLLPVAPVLLRGRLLSECHTLPGP